MLTQVPAAPAAVAGAGVFVLVVVGMLVVGMGVLLVLNTALAQDAFEVGALNQTRAQLADQEQQLAQQVALRSRPTRCSAGANALGMVPVAAPVFLRLADGDVLGTPVPAKALTRAERVQTLPSTGGAAPTTAKKAVVPAGDAAVADPAPQTDAAVADATKSGGAR